MRRFPTAVALAAALPLIGCPSEPTSQADTRQAPTDTAATKTTADAGATAADIGVSALESVGAPDTTERVAPHPGAAATAPAPRDGGPATPVGGASPRALDGLLGLPAASGDGMHVAYLIGSETEGPMLMRIVRLDGSVLVEQPLFGKRREQPADGRGEQREAALDALDRRGRARLEAARKTLERSRMQPLTALPLDRHGAGAVTLRADDVTLSMAGFVAQTHPLATLEREVPVCDRVTERDRLPCAASACRAPQEVVGAWRDAEHGLVILRLSARWGPACPRPEHPRGADEEWRIFALDRATSDAAPAARP